MALFWEKDSSVFINEFAEEVTITNTGQVFKAIYDTTTEFYDSYERASVSGEVSTLLVPTKVAKSLNLKKNVLITVNNNNFKIKSVEDDFGFTKVSLEKRV